MYKFQYSWCFYNIWCIFTFYIKDICFGCSCWFWTAGQAVVLNDRVLFPLAMLAVPGQKVSRWFTFPLPIEMGRAVHGMESRQRWAPASRQRWAPPPHRAGGGGGSAACCFEVRSETDKNAIILCLSPRQISCTPSMSRILRSLDHYY